MNISIPGADYTPQLTGYTGQGAFRFWCQKVLPIVYDDSLSYYELLNKVVNYLNNVIADVANVEQNVGELNDSYISLQSYVNEHMQEIVDVVNEYTEFTTNYFNNLDVQEEINTKLDKMASDGSLSALIGPIVAITAPDIITRWLTEHITPTAPPVDDTLTISGAAADAKVTGEKITKLEVATAYQHAVSASDYNYKLSNIDEPCIFNPDSSDGWTDMPFNGASGAFFNFKYSKTYFVQKICCYPSMRIFERITQPSTQTVVTQWTEYEQSKIGNNVGFFIPKEYFRTGSIYNGVITPSQVKRICTYPIMLNNKRPVVLLIGEGFMVRVDFYDSKSNYISNSGWQTNTAYTVPANSYYRVSIARITEVEEVADIEEFRSSLCCFYHGTEMETVFERDFNKCKFDIGIFRTGGIYKGALAPSHTNRICSWLSTMKFDYDIVINLEDDDFRYVIAYYDASGSYISDSDLLTSSLGIPAGTYFKIVIRRETEITETAYIPDFIDAVSYSIPSNVAVEKIREADRIFNNKFDEEIFRNGSIYRGVITPSQVKRVCTYPIMLSFDYDLLLDIDDGFNYQVDYYDENNIFLSNTGLFHNTYRVPAGSFFRISISRVNEVTDEIADISTFVSKLHYSISANEAIKSLEEKLYSYKIGYGENVYLKRMKYNIQLIEKVKSTIHSGKAEQGFAINNGVLFQLYSNDEVEMIDFETGEIINDIVVDSGHGNTIDFSDEYYEEGDEFPLAYITTGSTTTNSVVNVIRFTRSTATVLRSYIFDGTKTGYYAGHILDSVNKIIYMVGHVENSYYENPNGTNYTVVSKWDLKNVINKGNNVYAPEFKGSFEIPFIMTPQGQTMYNNLLVICSSHWENTSTELIFIDPNRQIICSKITEFPEYIKNVETEGVAFVEEKNEYYIVLKPGGHTSYYKLISNM